MVVDVVETFRGNTLTLLKRALYRGRWEKLSTVYVADLFLEASTCKYVKSSPGSAFIRATNVPYHGIIHWFRLRRLNPRVLISTASFSICIRVNRSPTGWSQIVVKYRFIFLDGYTRRIISVRCLKRVESFCLRVAVYWIVEFILKKACTSSLVKFVAV